jgi:tetratricopeptide (TPR) repeat protein
LRDQGRYREAEPLYRQVLEVRRESLPEDAVQIAYSLHGLGWVLAETERPGEAEPHLREMLRILESEGDDLGSVRYRVGRNTLGRTLSLLGRQEEATRLLEESWPWVLEAAPDSPLMRTFGTRLSAHYASMGRHEEAAQVRAVAGGS